MIDDVICIWNPSLFALLTLLSYPIPYDSYGVIEIDLRFGFDPKTDYYKVVKLTSIVWHTKKHYKLPHCVKDFLEVEVYSMKKGSWEFITQRFPPHITMHCPKHEVSVDGNNGHFH